MKILKEKIIKKEVKKKYYMIEKNFNLKIILWIFYSFFFLLYIKKFRITLSKTEGLNSYILLSVFLLSLLVYTSSLLFNLSKEKLEINSQKIVIRKFIFCYCYYNKEILINNIIKINYVQNNSLWVLLLFTPLFFNGNNNIIIQLRTEEEEDKEFYFGVGLKLKEYSELCRILREILGEDYKKIKFTQFLK